MAIPFYNQGDQDIYAGGQHFIPQERFRLGYTPPPSIANAQTTAGITNTQAANPYLYPPQQGGGGGGGGFSNTNKYGLDLDTQKTITSGQWVGNEYVKNTRNIAKDASGNWKDVDTNQNPYHANIGFKGMIGTVMDKAMGKESVPGVPDEGSWTGTEWDDEFDPTIANRKLNTIQRWKAKKEFKAAQEKAAEIKEANDAAAAANAAHQARVSRYEASKASGREGGHWYGGSDYKGGASGDVQQAGPGRDKDDIMAQGGRVGYNRGRVVNPGGYSGDTWRDFLASKNEWVVDPRDNSWKDVYYRWLDSQKAEGGRIGYRDGLFVDENIEGPNYDFNEGMEIASNPDPMAEIEAFSLQIFNKSYDKLNDEERDILFDLMNDQAMGSEQDQGIASLV